MPSTPNKSEDEITPRQLLCLNRVGTGQDFDKAAYQDFLVVHGVKLASDTRRMIKDLTGYSTSELHQLAPNVHLSSTPEAKAVRSKIKKQLLKEFPFLKEYQENHKEGGLRKLSRKADDYIRSILDEYFPGEDDVQMSDEVATCNDAEMLVLMAFHDGLDPKIKFEASRKLLLMKLIGEIENFNKKQVDHDKALGYMTDFFNRRINQLPHGTRLGQGFNRYLVTRHNNDDLETMGYDILDTKPEPSSLGKRVRVTPMRCRRTVVKDEHGKERPIFFRKHPRDKEMDARLTKALRYNSPIGKRDGDRNGIRLIFDNRADWDDFYRMFKEEMQNDIECELKELLSAETDPDRVETLESRLRDIESSITIYDEEDTMDGKEFKGSAASSSSKLKIYKFGLKVIRGDGRIHVYEIQAFLPDGYGDYLYRKGVSWEEYNVDRFFRENVDELLFPKKIYPGPDRQKVRAKVMKIAHQKVWNGNGNGSDHSASAPEPERTPNEEVKKDEEEEPIIPHS